MTMHAEAISTRAARARVDVARWLPSLLLAGYGIFILSLFARGVLTWYINPAYVIPTTVAGVALLGLAGTRLRRNAETCGCDACSAEGSCGCAEDRTRLWPSFALGIPLLLAVLFPPRGLQAFSALQRGPQVAGLATIHSAATVHRVSLSVDTRSFTLQDWVGALSADPNPRDYLGKPVILSGLVLHTPASAPSGYLTVIRYQVTCCIADARPEGLIVRDTSHGSLKDGQWVTVRGTMSQVKYDGQNVAVVKPSSLVRTKAGNPYMY